jgi:hypothetical protein
MDFKEWLKISEAGEFGGHGEPQPENPKLGAVAMHDYHGPNSSQIPPVKKKRIKKRNFVKFT